MRVNRRRCAALEIGEGRKEWEKGAGLVAFLPLNREKKRVRSGREKNEEAEISARTEAESEGAKKRVKTPASPTKRMKTESRRPGREREREESRC